MDDAQPSWHHADFNFCIFQFFQVCCTALSCLHPKRFAGMELLLPRYQCCYQRVGLGGSLLKRIYIPSTVFGVSAIGTALVNLILSLVPLLLVMLIDKAPFFESLLFLPVSILLLTAFTLGFGLFISSLAVFFPDVAEMYQVLLTAWMYLTPIIYPESLISARFMPIYKINPMYWMVKMFRLPIFEGRMPTSQEFLPALAWSSGMLVIGWIYFTSKSEEYAYRV